MVETIFTIFSISIGLGTLIWGVKSYRDQMNAQLFLEFTKRFEEVMQSFPKNSWCARLDINGVKLERSEELSLSALRYLNLCSEEYYLYKKGWLHKEIWRIWEEELVRTLQTPLFIREWKALADEFTAYPQFKEYVTKAQSNLKS